MLACEQFGPARAMQIQALVTESVGVDCCRGDGCPLWDILSGRTVNPLAELAAYDLAGDDSSPSLGVVEGDQLIS